MNQTWTAQIKVALAATLILLSAGCSTTQYQQLYFAAVDIEDTNPTVSYYRVTTKAKATNKTMEFLAGFYDANAVRQLYGQVGAPEGGNASAVRGTSGPTSISYNPKLGAWQPINEQVYTIIFGADASAIAEQIETFAKSDVIGKQIGSLLASAVVGDDFEEAQELEADLSSGKTRLSANIEAQAEAVDSASTVTELRTALEKSLRAVAVELARINGLPTVIISADLTELVDFIKNQKALFEQNR